MSKRQTNTIIICIFTAIIGAIAGNLSYFEIKFDCANQPLTYNYSFKDILHSIKSQYTIHSKKTLARSYLTGLIISLHSPLLQVTTHHNLLICIWHWFLVRVTASSSTDGGVECVLCDLRKHRQLWV